MASWYSRVDGDSGAPLRGVQLSNVKCSSSTTDTFDGSGLYDSSLYISAAMRTSTSAKSRKLSSHGRDTTFWHSRPMESHSGHCCCCLAGSYNSKLVTEFSASIGR